MSKNQKMLPEGRSAGVRLHLVVDDNITGHEKLVPP
jgi:hypothetical protein